METTIFEKIILGELPCHKVYEDEFVLAFLSKGQKTRGHTLVIPKTHSRNILDIEENDLFSVIKVVRALSKHLYVILKASGIKIIQNNEVKGGQEVFHTHFHIIPRYNSDSTYIGDEMIEMSDSELGKLSREIYFKPIS